MPKMQNVIKIIDEYRSTSKIITLEKGGVYRYRVKAVYFFDDEEHARAEFDRASTTPRKRGRPPKKKDAV